ncbi:GTP-binding protein 10, partial [Toxocara canis]
FTRENMPGARYYDGKKLNIPITDESAEELLERWMLQALSSLMSAVAHQKSEHLNEYHRNRLFKCSKEATDIHEHAKCVVAVLDASKHQTGQHPHQDGRFEKLRRVMNDGNERILGVIIRNSTRVITTNNRKSSMARSRYRTKREAVRRSHYRLYSEYENMTPVGIIGKYMARTAKIVKRKKTSRTWEALIADLMEKQKKIAERQKFRESLQSRIAKMLGTSNLSKVEKRLKEVLSIDAIERTEQNDKKKQDEQSVQLLRSAIKLAMILSGDNRTDVQNRTLKIASPRLLSIVPDEIKDEIDILSPSLFSLHNNGKGTEALMSLSNLIKDVKTNDFGEWLEFIIEVSGVPDAIDLVVVESRFDDAIRNGPRGIDNQPMYFTKENVTEIAGAEEGRKVEMFESLSKELNRKQLSELHQDGYSIMTPEQLELVYGERSTYRNSSLLRRFLAMNETAVRQCLLSNIRELANNGNLRLAHRSRVKREIFVLSPIVLQLALFRWTPTTVLSPILLSASIFSPNILGPVILSPWLFNPIILGPRVIVPTVLSPFIYDDQQLKGQIHRSRLPDLFLQLVSDQYMILMDQENHQPDRRMREKQHCSTNGKEYVAVIQVSKIWPCSEKHLELTLSVGPYRQASRGERSSSMELFMILIREPVSLKIFQLILLVSFAYAEMEYTRETMPGAQFYDGKKLKIPISDEAGYEMYERWALQGISSIMSAIANEKLDNLNEYHRNKLYKCSQKAEDIYEQANCLVNAMDAAEPLRRKNESEGSRLSKIKDVLNKTEGAFVIGNGGFIGEEDALGLKRNRTSITIMHNDRPKVEFRTKREAIKKAHYKLHTEYENLTPFGLIGKYLSQTVKQVKHKNKDKSWGSVISEIEMLQKKIEQRKNAEAELKKRFKFAKYGANQLFANKGFSKAERMLIDNVAMPNDFAEHARIDSEIKQKQSNLTMDLVRRGIQLAMAISGNNTDITNKTLKIASPRLLSVVPEEQENDIALLSPSLFSLHNKGRGTEALLSLPNVIQKMDNNDYQHWLNFIIETSGVSDAVEEVLIALLSPSLFSLHNKGRGTEALLSLPNVIQKMDNNDYQHWLNFIIETSGVSDAVEEVLMAEFNTTGFSVLTPEQIHLVYGEESPFNNSEALQRFSQMDEWTVRKAMLQNIRDLAKKGQEHTDMGMRKKRSILLSPIVNGVFINAAAELSTPLILSPVLFALVLFSPAIFGPVILSPWIFVAVILSPRIMCPVIVAPVSLSAVVLSPICMNPLVLSPGAMVPFILSPLVLSPNILSPSVLSPVILSPFALSANIFNPTAVTAIVLSPFVLAPSICSPSYVAALILSPHAFAPLINSTGKAVTLMRHAWFRLISTSARSCANKKMNDMSIIDEDRIRLSIRAGHGGFGILRYNGIGGDGGNVYMVGQPNLDFRDVRKRLAGSRKIRAGDGQNALYTKLVGTRGEDAIFHVPVGVEAVDAETSVLIARCKRPFHRYLVARGGPGGCPDNHYQQVLFSLLGRRGECCVVDFHLKLRPNIGLVGFPNAGKSTIMKALIPKKTIKIASYPFTTRKPQLCYVRDFDDMPKIAGEDEFSLSIADLPGIIEGASSNRGRGVSFLKHLEYSDMLLMVVDVTGFKLDVSPTEPFRSALETVALLNIELERYSPHLVTKPTILAVNKIDLPNGEEKASKLIDILRQEEWTKSVSEAIRPQRPLMFDALIPTAAKEGRIGDLKSKLRSIYAYVHRLSDPIEESSSSNSVRLV